MTGRSACVAVLVVAAAVAVAVAAAAVGRGCPRTDHQQHRRRPHPVNSRRTWGSRTRPRQVPGLYRQCPGTTEGSVPGTVSQRKCLRGHRRWPGTARRATAAAAVVAAAQPSSAGGVAAAAASEAPGHRVLVAFADSAMSDTLHAIIGRDIWCVVSRRDRRKFCQPLVGVSRLLIWSP